MTLAEYAADRGFFEPPSALYIHIPLCEARCGYCDFHSFAKHAFPPALQDSYVTRILEQAEGLKRQGSLEPETLYVGGGTPTALSRDSFSRILGGLGGLFREGLKEWTVEANPESLSDDALKAMLDSGVNRISLGIQSMVDGELESLGRRARLADNATALRKAVDSGLEVSADLMAAIPGQSAESLQDSLSYLIELGLGHISLYDLVLEKGTLLEARVKRGELKLPGEDAAYDARKKAERLLQNQGYERYEISNFCLPGKESRHNGRYWSMDSYIGIGSGAVSSLMARGGAEPEAADSLLSPAFAGYGCLRIEEGKDLDAYLADPEASKVENWIEWHDVVFETVMMGLRTRKGLSRRRFAGRFSRDLDTVLKPGMDKWKNRFVDEGDFLRLDDRGMDLLNPILVDILDSLQPPK